MRHSLKDKHGIWKHLGESHSIEDALLEKEHDDPVAIAMEAALQANINSLLGLSPELDPVPPEPRNRGGAPKGNKNASKRKNNDPIIWSPLK